LAVLLVASAAAVGVSTATGCGLGSGGCLAIDVTGSTDGGAVETAAQAPYEGQPHDLPGEIPAEDFDEGGEGVAHHDTTADNLGGAYRNTSVDVEATGDGGYNVGWVEAGEWLEYTVDVDTAGEYAVGARVAAGPNTSDGGGFRLAVDGDNRTGTVGFEATDGWQNYTTVSAGTLTLTEGTHTIRVTATESDWNFDGLTVDLTDTIQMPYPDGPHAVPGRIQAQAFDSGAQGEAFFDTTNTSDGTYRDAAVDVTSVDEGEYAIEGTAAGEWLEYTVSVDQAGEYALAARTYSIFTGRYVHVAVDGQDRTGSVEVPAASGWATTDLGTVNLTSGEHVVRVAVEDGGWLLTWLEFSAVDGGGDGSTSTTTTTTTTTATTLTSTTTTSTTTTTTSTTTTTTSTTTTTEDSTATETTSNSDLGPSTSGDGPGTPDGTPPEDSTFTPPDAFPTQPGTGTPTTTGGTPSTTGETPTWTTVEPGTDTTGQPPSGGSSPDGGGPDSSSWASADGESGGDGRPDGVEPDAGVWSAGTEQETVRGTAAEAAGDRDIRDSDGDGVIDSADYAPHDADVQAKSDIEDDDLPLNTVTRVIVLIVAVVVPLATRQFA
jgi:hypothetical protein